MTVLAEQESQALQDGDDEKLAEIQRLRQQAEEQELKELEEAAAEKAQETSKVGTLTVTAVRATSVKAVDSSLFGKASSDPYLKLSFGGKTFETKTIKKNLNPEWNEEFKLEHVLHTQPITVEMWDHDKLGSNDKIYPNTLTVLLDTLAEQAGASPGVSFDYESQFVMDPADPCRLTLRFKYPSSPE